ncbi:MAG: hypothetical protein J6Q82_00885 [Clostridia bacterium]|nr:hypothetical protein [Clostridia bacterium]
MKQSNITIGTCFLTALKIWGSAWIGMLFSLLPVYVYRGISNSTSDVKGKVQDILVAIIGLLAASAALTFLVGRSDESECWTRKEACKIAAGAVGIYCFVWMVYWIFSPNNVYVSATGLYLSTMIGKVDEGNPTFLGAFLGALIYGIFYAVAIVLGGELARRRGKKRRKEIISPTKQD